VCKHRHNHTETDPHTKHIYHDWKLNGHGQVDLRTAIIVSCDTFYYHLAVKLGIDKIDDIMQRFGFGRKTGIDLNNELPGLVPSPAWKLKNQGEHWYTGDTIISAIGQGFMLTTPLQLATATTTLANRGQRVKPTLLLRTQNPDGSINTPAPIIEDPVMLEHHWVWHTIINAMEGVITSVNPFGTGFQFGRHPGYSIAAKTGTAQVVRKKHYLIVQQTLPKRLRDDSSFIAFAPVKHPKIAVAIIVEHSGIASTVARKVIDAYLIQNKKPKQEIHEQA